MINTTTTISDVLVEYAPPTGSDLSAQWSGTKKGSVIAQNADADSFVVGLNISYVPIADFTPSFGAAQEVSNQVKASGKIATIFAAYNDSESFLPWLAITQTVTDTTIGNTIQVVQGTAYRQVWG